MTQTTFEEAKTCPRCKRVGNEFREQRTADGGRLYEIECETELCPWYQTKWLVQVKRDGSIPQRRPGEKEFPKKPEGRQQQGRDQVRQLQEQMKQPGGAELRNPFAP